MTYQGRRLRNYQDPQSRAPFSTIPAFKAASFAPRESIGLKTLTTAVQHLEELVGEEVDIEEGAIAAAFKKLADDELKLLLPVAATVQANDLPVGEALEEYRQTLTGIQGAASDDCVRILAGEGRSFKENRDRARRIREAVTSDNLEATRRARSAIQSRWPVLEQRGRGPELGEAADELRSLLSSGVLYEHVHRIKELSARITGAYRMLYEERHGERAAAFAKAVEEVKGRAEWGMLAEEMRDTVLAPLSSRACDKADLPEDAGACRRCGAGVGEMETDMAALPALKGQVIARLQELTIPAEEDGTHVERVRLSEFFTQVLDSDAAVNDVVERLREHLLKLVAEGAKVVVE